MAERDPRRADADRPWRRSGTRRAEIPGGGEARRPRFGPARPGDYLLATAAGLVVGTALGSTVPLPLLLPLMLSFRSGRRPSLRARRALLSDRRAGAPRETLAADRPALSGQGPGAAARPSDHAPAGERSTAGASCRGAAGGCTASGRSLRGAVDGCMPSCRSRRSACCGVTRSLGAVVSSSVRRGSAFRPRSGCQAPLQSPTARCAKMRSEEKRGNAEPATFRGFPCSSIASQNSTELITQRSLVQIQPPQPPVGKQPPDPSGGCRLLRGR